MALHYQNTFGGVPNVSSNGLTDSKFVNKNDERSAD